MKLSELVQHKRDIENATPIEINEALTKKIELVLQVIEQGVSVSPYAFNRLSRDAERIGYSIRDFNETITNIKQDIDSEIAKIEPSYLSDSYYLYQTMMQSDTPDYILNRRINPEESVLEYLRDRLKIYSHWKKSGAILRPGLENWIDYMVACDPLYLIDTDHRLFDHTKQKFNDVYQNRLRYYAIKESNDPGMLTRLPNGQFGFFLAYNFFHYKPFEIIKNYLVEIHAKLSPGGCLAFTFNDCSLPGAIKLAEYGYMCYTPRQMICGVCENLGYEIVNVYEVDRATTWMEICKPGEMQSLKGGQTLAEIIAKSK